MISRVSPYELWSKTIEKQIDYVTYAFKKPCIDPKRTVRTSNGYHRKPGIITLRKRLIVPADQQKALGFDNNTTAQAAPSR